ncbi:hypothetical protein UA08_05033 [Talaromyces atroroseus]|uniref:Xylanolytic transcriptional activator regulatory domain-containing protein n=1 Tax=Talaromyces atroroseus TaxID=1441469 RepID=A0A225B129_TALAT|nr:hypothetical protein UA08_05033 [Talaromyces atroroseus]OKL59507.1 hypothetical protein UA08_05033 [Talaromyces atroroseus]
MQVLQLRETTWGLLTVECPSKIHSHPEIKWEEVYAHDILCNYFSKQGFAVERGVGGLPTAFRASFGPETGADGQPSRAIAINLEYDALPIPGHACGHNLIATAGLSAALGLSAAIKAGSIQGRVVAIGTPAEEGGGGKIKLIKADLYKDIFCCMMVHPMQQDNAYFTSMCGSELTIRYIGKPAHAMAAPWDGVNALDAMTLFHTSIGLLRQQIMPTDRIRGVHALFLITTNSSSVTVWLLDVARAFDAAFTASRILDVRKISTGEQVAPRPSAPLIEPSPVGMTYTPDPGIHERQQLSLKDPGDGVEKEVSDIAANVAVLSLSATGEMRFMGGPSGVLFSRLIASTVKEYWCDKDIERRNITRLLRYLDNEAGNAYSDESNGPDSRGNQELPQFSTAKKYLTTYLQWLCIDMGLHRHNPDWSFTVDEWDIRRRLFWVTYALDRTVCFNLGRPLTLSDDHIDALFPSPERHGHADEPNIALALHHIQLRSIQTRIISEVYTVSKSKTTIDYHQRVQILDAIQKELDDWRNRLDSIYSSHQTPHSFQWYKRLYHTTTASLHRATPLFPRPSEESIKRCYNASTRAVRIYHSLLRSHEMEYSWMFISGCYLAGITMFYTLWSSGCLPKTVRLDEVTESCRMCSNVLAVLSVQWRASPEFIDTYEALANITTKRLVKELQQRCISDAAYGSNDMSLTQDTDISPESGLLLDSLSWPQDFNFSTALTNPDCITEVFGDLLREQEDPWYI